MITQNEINRNKVPPSIPATVNDQWNFLLSTIWNQMIHLVIRFDGSLDDGVLQCAVDRVVEAEPLVSTRFVPTRQPFFSKLEDQVPVFSVIETEGPDHALHQILSARLDPKTGPMAMVRLIRSDHDLLVISANHTITDAYGVKFLGSSLARHYRAGSNGYLPLKNHHDRSFTTIFRQFTREERKLAWKRYGKQEMGWSLPVNSIGRDDAQYRLVSCPGAVMILREKAAQLGVTVNDILLSGYIHSIGTCVEEATGIERKILTSMDLRRYLPPDSFPSLANLSVAFEVPFLEIKGNSFYDTVRDVHRAMSERKNGHAGIGAAENICMDFSSGFQNVRERLMMMEQDTRRGGLPKKPFFSNMGVIPEGVLAFGNPNVTEAFLLPPIEYPPGFGVSACTSQGSLILSCGFCGRSLAADWVSGFLKTMSLAITRAESDPCL